MAEEDMMDCLSVYADQIDMVKELSKHMRSILAKEECREHVPAWYIAEWLDCLDSFI